MSIDAVKLAFAHQDLSSTQKLVLVAMAFYSDDEGKLAMSLSNIAKKTCLSQSSIVTAINLLCDKRLVKRVSVGGIKDRSTTEYRVMI